MKWSLDDVRIIGDIVAASLLARMVQLVALKAFIEPAGHFIGTAFWQRLRGLSGDRLPALLWVSAFLEHPDVDNALGDQRQHSIPQVDVVHPEATECRV
jgi:hypothetical protein